MALVRLKDGCVFIQEGDVSFPPTADEIYSVVFEGNNSVRGFQLTEKDFLAAELAFSMYTADPTVVLDIASEKQPVEILCRLMAQFEDREGGVARNGDAFLDYAIVAGTWMPLPPGSCEAAKEHIRRAGIEDFGTVTLAQYLQVLRLRDGAVFLEDRTHEALRASAIVTTLGGPPPAGFEGTLYRYQEAGYYWLSYMCRNGLGGIIADEMGLGKTVQVICLLLEMCGQNQRPNLVVSPATLIENWRRELQRFAPGLDVYVHKGATRTGFPNELRCRDIVITSFETAVADISLFRNLMWNAIVVDEAQGIKNPVAKRKTQLQTLKRKCAIAITGTPVENRLKDLWSITDFVTPSLLGPLSEFERRHPDTIDGASMLEPLVSPIILRRRISEVAQDLPPRIDIAQPLELDHESAKVYEAIRSEAASRAGASLTTLIGLRQFCTHPWLVGQFTHLSDALDCSVKLQRLIQVLEEVTASNGKTIIFTSYQGAVDLLSKEIEARLGVLTDVIDGRVAVSERQEKVDAFASFPGAAVLILNPKAAGTGLNITAANHVIHFNLEWNPAVEDQASARAHRRGQTQTVTVHRFFYVDTVEEVINERMKRKRDIAEAAVVGTDGSEAAVEDIMRALRVSPLNHNPGKRGI